MVSKEFLLNEYVKKKKSMNEIAAENNIAVGTVYNYLKKYGIKSRDRMTDETKKKISKSLTGKPSKFKGVPISEERKKKISESKKGKFLIHSRFGGHTKRRTDGYVAVYVPDHVSANKEGYVMEHILVMEAHIGRHLSSDEVVHHINRNRSDNRLENLRLMNKREHARMHMKERHEKKRGVMTYQ